MSGKGSNRRPTNEAAYAEGFDRIFGKKLLGSSSTVEQAVLSGTVEGSNPSSPAFQERIKGRVATLQDRLAAVIKQHTVVNKVTGCWNWQRYIRFNGYGELTCGGVKYKAHRAAFMAHNGPIPDGACVLHSCDNRRCCNPDHLSLGTQAENLADMYQKGRGRERLIPPISDEAAPVVVDMSISQRRAAAMLGVSRDVVRAWRGRRPRKHVYVDDATGKLVDENYWPGD